MEPLRLVLLAGLISHKLTWEVLRLRGQALRAETRRTSAWGKRLTKSAKALALAFVLIQTLFLNLLPITSNAAVLRWTGLLVFGLGLAMAIVGRLQLGRNWANIEDAHVGDSQQLVSRGIYGYIRHPIYAGDILLFIGLELALNSWLVLGALPLILMVTRQADREETQLAQSLAGYQDYRKRTKRFLPFVV